MSEMRTRGGKNNMGDSRRKTPDGEPGRNRRGGARSRDLRSAVAMVCVSLAMLSTATYAWFTVTSNPSVEGLELTAATKGGLEISWSTDSGWSSSIEVTDYNGTKTEKLTPVTVTDTAPSFGEPSASHSTAVQDSEITTVDQNENDSFYKNYVAKYTYYLRTTGSSDVKVGLVTSGDDKTYIQRKSGSTSASAEAANAVRIGFKSGSKWVIYDPNSDKTESSSTNYLAQQDDTSYPSGTKYSSGDTLFTVSGSSGYTTVDMYVWIEGTDRSCVNEIMADELEGRIQFETIS